MLSPAPPLSQQLKAATSALHREAEAAGVMGRLLRGAASREDYRSILQALHPVYQALEGGLADHSAHPILGSLLRPALRRLPGLEKDLDFFGATASSGNILSMRISSLANSRPLLLASHGYVRYLGDLAGGRILAGLLTRQLDLPPGEGLAFLSFPPELDPAAEGTRIRALLDGIPEPNHAEVLEEARHAFHLHIRLFRELAEGPPMPAPPNAPA